jgi:hypothetical protein
LVRLKALYREAYCDMKIKEKGLTGKAATTRKASMATRPRGFNAFQEMSKGNKDKGGKDKSKPEIWLEFMGTKLRVHEENGGSVKSENVPYVKGATLKFTGCGGDVSFRDIKVCLPLFVDTHSSDDKVVCSNRCKTVSSELHTLSTTKGVTGALLASIRPYLRTILLS